MPFEVVVPEVGEAGMEIRFAGWLRQEGDEIRAGDPLFELDTDKATMEVEAFADGLLADLRVEAGEVVHPRQVVALLLTEGETPPMPQPEPQVEPATAEPEARGEPAPVPAVSEQRGDLDVHGEPRAMPRARALARERGIALAEIRGTGGDGTITVSDVEGFARARSKDGGLGDDRAARIRRAVADMTTRAWREIPHFHLNLEADATEALRRWRPMVAICGTVSRALERHPECNLQWTDGRPVQRQTVDLGILVDTPSGLLLPAVRDAAALDPEELRAEIADAAQRAYAGALRPADQDTRSISVSNLGIFAVDSVSGVIPAPDVLLLGVGRVRRVPRWRHDTWEPRDVITLTLSVDHRAIDGADGARLLDTLEALLTEPEAIW